VVYDADCGPCSSFKRALEAADAKRRLDFVSLQEAEEKGLLERVPSSERGLSSHLVYPDGSVLSGPSWMPDLLSFLPLGRALRAAAEDVPPLASLLTFLYVTGSRLHSSPSCNT